MSFKRHHHILSTPGSLVDEVFQLGPHESAEITWIQDNAGTRIKIQQGNDDYIAGALGSSSTYVEGAAGMVVPQGGKITLKGTTGAGEACLCLSIHSE